MSLDFGATADNALWLTALALNAFCFFIFSFMALRGLDVRSQVAWVGRAQSSRVQTSEVHTVAQVQ